MNYKLNLGAWGSVFAVPSCVVDNYIKIADGIQLKVLLYLLKNSSAPMRAEDIAAVTGVEPYEAEDALLFWENVGVLAKDTAAGELIPAEGRAFAAEQPRSSYPSAGMTAAKVKLSADTQFPPKEIASAVNSDEAYRYLFDTFERLAGRPTKHTERNTLMLLTEEIGMPCEVALMLVEYCFSIDKATPVYMKSVALEWVESGIDSITKAEERIKLLKSRRSLESCLRSRFGVTSAFSRSQKDIINEWAEAGFSPELIDEAYDLCMKNTGKLNLKYMDKVLKSWAEKGIASPEQVKNDKKPQAAGASFDPDELKQAAYAKYKKRGEN